MGGEEGEMKGAGTMSDDYEEIESRCQFAEAALATLKGLVREFLRESFNPSTPGNDERWLQLGEQLERILNEQSI